MRSIVFAFLAVLTVSEIALGSMEVSKKLQLQEMIERRLTPVIQALDVEAKVYVTLEVSEEVEPTNYNVPFALQKYIYSGSQSFSKVNVLVLGRMKELPNSTKNMIRKLTKDLGAPVTLTLESLSSLPKSEYSEREPATIKVHGLEVFRKSFSHLGDVLMALLGLISFLGCVGAIFFFKSKNEENENAQNLEENNSEALKGYTEETLTSILSDCYWCEEDAYGAYLWSKTPVEKRKDIINSTGFLAKYVETILGMEGSDKGYLRHPYYLNPQSVNHLDNKTLTEMVRKHPGLLNKLSPMRRDHLALTACERIKAELETGNKTPGPDLMRLPPDRERGFSPGQRIMLNSIQEEEEVLRMKDLSLDLKARIPSLRWLCELSPENRSVLLESVSARELASAWVGPKAVLDVLKTSLPLKKREELQAYLEEVKPSRESECFRNLHSMAIEVMRSEALKNHGTKIKKVA